MRIGIIAQPAFTSEYTSAIIRAACGRQFYSATISSASVVTIANVQIHSPEAGACLQRWLDVLKGCSGRHDRT